MTLWHIFKINMSNAWNILKSTWLSAVYVTRSLYTLLFLGITILFKQQTIVLITAFPKAGVVFFQRHEEIKYITQSISEGYEMYLSLLHLSTGMIPFKFLYCLKYSANFPLSGILTVNSYILFCLGKENVCFHKTLPNVFYCRKYSLEFHACLYNGFPAFENKPEIWPVYLYRIIHGDRFYWLAKRHFL